MDQPSVLLRDQIPQQQIVHPFHHAAVWVTVLAEERCPSQPESSSGKPHPIGVIGLEPVIVADKPRSLSAELTVFRTPMRVEHMPCDIHGFTASRQESVERHLPTGQDVGIVVHPY